MADEGDRHGDADGLVASPVCIGDVGSEQRSAVDPEGVESSLREREVVSGGGGGARRVGKTYETGRSVLAEAESTRSNA